MSGALFGLSFVGEPAANLSTDSHFRYLSGLLLAIGIAFASCIPRIEAQTARVRLLTFLVVIGGIARLYGMLATGMPEAPMQGALVMELLVTPALCLWQTRVARKMRGMICIGRAAKRIDQLPPLTFV